MTNKIGILLTNTGTPDAPTTTAVRRYLREFLSDKRIVQLPRLIWLPILYGLVLPTRSHKSAQLYQKIWGKTDSPMREIMNHLRDKLSTKLHTPVEIGMNYGNPSIASGLAKLEQQQVDNMVVIPLYPQYSHTTTGSTLDRIPPPQKRAPAIQIHTINQYADQPNYIHALAESVRHAWQVHGRSEHLLISFHGIPQSFVDGGDPYPTQCELTAKLLTQALSLPNDKWTLCYQSQFGYAKWLQPATFDVLAALPQQGITNIDVICPGFSIDCLETLEEISIRGNAVFHEAGGKTLNYIPALNDADEHVNMLVAVAKMTAP